MPSARVADGCHAPPSTRISTAAIPETASVPVAFIVTAEIYQPFSPGVPFSCREAVGREASYRQLRFPEMVRPKAELTVKIAVPVPSGRATTQFAPQLNGCPAVPLIVKGKPCGSEALISRRAFSTHQPRSPQRSHRISAEVITGGRGVGVKVGLGEGVGVQVVVGVNVGVGDNVIVGVRVQVAVGVSVGDIVIVMLGVGVCDTVAVDVDVGLAVGVVVETGRDVGVLVRVDVRVAVGNSLE